MGTSSWTSFIDTLECFQLINPKSILDVGIGFGRYGFVAREVLDYGVDDKGVPLPWKIRIDGVEIFENTIRPYHQYIYDNIYIGDAFEIIRDFDNYYDMIYLGDVLEHFTKARGIQFIINCGKKADVVLINTPYVYYDQGACECNEYENHLSGWDMYDLKSLGVKYIFKSGISLLGIFSQKDLPFHPSIRSENMVDQFNKEDMANFKLMLQKYLETNQIEECNKACKRYINLFDNDFEVNFLLAYSYELLGNKIQAYEFAHKCLKLVPDNQLCTELIDRLKS